MNVGLFFCFRLHVGLNDCFQGVSIKVSVIAGENRVKKHREDLKQERDESRNHTRELFYLQPKILRR